MGGATTRFFRIALELIVGITYLILEPNHALQLCGVAVLGLFVAQIASPEPFSQLTDLFDIYLTTAVGLYLTQHNLSLDLILPLVTLFATLILLGSYQLEGFTAVTAFLYAILYAFIFWLVARIPVAPPLLATSTALLLGMVIETPRYSHFPRWKFVATYGMVLFTFSASIALILYLLHA